MKHVSQHHGRTVAADSTPSEGDRSIAVKPLFNDAVDAVPQCVRLVHLPWGCFYLIVTTFRCQLCIGGRADRAGCNARPTNAAACRARVEIGGRGRAGGRRADRVMDDPLGHTRMPARMPPIPRMVRVPHPRRRLRPPAVPCRGAQGRVGVVESASTRSARACSSRSSRPKAKPLPPSPGAAGPQLAQQPPGNDAVGRSGAAITLRRRQEPPPQW